ncbi:MAG TPA: alpha/beta fold hydrolase, partial [Candidatus Acidoferrales bacterium]|nr:alpha/beta fold hydrolase [Candidatus Acidoferrales bacterium]
MDARKYAWAALPLGRAWTRRARVTWSPPAGAIRRLALNVRSHGSGPPVLLLHGLGGSHRYWGAAYDALASEHRLIVPDLLGFGGSPASAGGYSADRHCEALLALLDDLKVAEPVVVAGHSVGSLIGLRLAVLRPERCAGVVALAPPLFCSAAELQDHFAGLGWAERAIAFEMEPAASALGWASVAGPLGTGAAVL